MRQLIVEFNPAEADMSPPSGLRLHRLARSQGLPSHYLAGVAFVPGGDTPDAIAKAGDDHEYVYAARRTGQRYLHENNTLLLQTVLPRWLDWLQPDLVRIVNPGQLGWNLVRAIRSHRRDCTLQAVITELQSKASAVTSISGADDVVLKSLYEDSLALCDRIDVQSDLHNGFVCIHTQLTAGLVQTFMQMEDLL